MTLIGEFFDRWVFYIALFLMTLAYGVCRFPITRGTSAKDIDGGFLDFSKLAILWFQVAIGITLIFAVAQLLNRLLT
jgi:hypothetical protein